MSKRLRIALTLGASLLALAFAGQALAAYTPRVTFSSSPQSVTVGYQQGNDDDATARITFFAPVGAEANLSQSVGTDIGGAFARVFATELQTEITLTGDVLVGDKTNATLQALGMVCTGTASHDAIWVLRVAVGSAEPLDIPAFVDRASGATATFSSLTITVCFRSPYIPPAQGGAPQGNKPLAARLTLNGVFSFPSASPSARWTGLFIPWAPGTATVNPLAAAESQVIAQQPVRFGLNAKLVRKTKKVKRKGKTVRVKVYRARLTGRLRAGGQAVSGAPVVLRAGKKAIAVTRTNSAGAFSRLVRLSKTTTFTATARRGPGASSDGCQPLIPLGPGLNPTCTGVTIGEVTASASRTVRKPKK